VESVALSPDNIFDDYDHIINIHHIVEMCDDTNVQQLQGDIPVHHTLLVVSLLEFGFIN
jgi:hypothetical protein